MYLNDTVNFHIRNVSANNILTKQYFVQIWYGNVESDYKNTFQIIKKKGRCINIVYCKAVKNYKAVTVKQHQIA